ncbi:hypothetical protein [Aestuariivirga sp.]|uniref:hypothetical protein n=1 Tax=Aestuariivirga sp. TaxID=2650926 RepID=UPI003918D9FD
MLTISQLAEVLGREYEAVSNWRKRGLMPYAKKIGRDYVLDADGVFRVRVALELVGFADLALAFKIAQLSPVTVAIELLKDPEVVASFFLVVHPVTLTFKDNSEPTSDIAVGLLHRRNFAPDEPGGLRFDGSMDLSQVKSVFVMTHGQAVSSVRPGVRFTILDLSTLWTETFMSIEKISRDDA